jgi:transposase
MRYGIELRKRVMAYVEDGHSQADASRVFKIHPKTVENWNKLKQKTGGLEAAPEKPRKFRTIDPEKVKQIIAENPDIFIREIAEKLNASINGVFQLLKRSKITRKKRQNYIKKEMKVREKNIKRRYVRLIKAR